MSVPSADVCKSTHLFFFIMDRKDTLTNTKEADDIPFRVEVHISGQNISIEPGKNFFRAGVFIDSGIFTITAAQSRQDPDLPAEASSNPASDGFRWAMQSVYN